MSRRLTGTCWSIRSAIRLSRGPRQHFTRPAINPLFRSVARSFGPRVIGVVLSGTGNDGAVGLREIQQAGGLTVIQHPEAALYPDMPRNALRAVRPDILPGLDELGPLLVRLSAETVEIPATRAVEEGDTMPDQFERPVALTCPECGGSMRHTGNGPTAEFRCHTGHYFGVGEVAEGQRSALEEALVVAVRVLNERVELCRQMRESARTPAAVWASGTGSGSSRRPTSGSTYWCGSSNTSRRPPRRNRTARPARRDVGKNL